MRWPLVLVTLLFSLPARAVTIDWVPVGNAGNAPDTPSTNCYADDCGSVAYDYWISKYEVTNAQYAEFLNAKASAGDPLYLYDENFGGEAITRGFTGSAYTYTVVAGFENKPVVYVSFYDSLRFANWLNNGQGGASTEIGAYTLLGGTATPSNWNTVARNGGANIFLPSENEWYKAAFYSPGGVYFDYPTGTDSVTDCVAPEEDTGNSANCDWAVGALTDIGAYALSGSPYGTFDQGGNVWEWNEQSRLSANYRGIRGGDLGAPPEIWLVASYPAYWDPRSGGGVAAVVGFRVASLVPEPDPGLLGVTAILGLAAWRKRTAKAL